MKNPPRRRGKPREVLIKTFVWVLLVIFVVTSVGVALVVTTVR